MISSSNFGLYSNFNEEKKSRKELRFSTTTFQNNIPKYLKGDFHKSDETLRMHEIMFLSSSEFTMKGLNRLI